MQKNTWDIPALLAFHRSVFGDARMEGEGEVGDGTGDGAKVGDNKAEGDKTFTQADVDRMIADRLKRAKPADYDDLKKAKQRLDEIEAANASDLEKAVKTARDEGEATGRAAAVKELAPQLVAAQFQIAAGSRMTAEQVSELLEDLDTSKYLTETGEVDTARVTKKVDALAPEQSPKPPPSFGGGPRQPVSAPADPRAADLAQIEADLAASRRRT